MTKLDHCLAYAQRTWQIPAATWQTLQDRHLLLPDRPYKTDTCSYDRHLLSRAHGCSNHDSWDRTILLSFNWGVNNEMWYIHTMEYYAADKKNETMKSVGKWMEIERTILS